MLNSIRAIGFVRYIETVRSWEGPLWEVPLYTCTGVLKISLAGANNSVPTTGLTPCIIIIHVYTCNYSGAGKNIDAR